MATTIRDLYIDVQPISAWHETLLPRLTGADESAIDIEIGSTVNDFLRFSTAFYVEYPLTTEALKDTYKLELTSLSTRIDGVLSPISPLFTVPLQVFSVERVGESMTFPLKLIDMRPLHKQSGVPYAAFFPQPLVMELYPIPSGEHNLVVKMPLKLRLPVTHVPQMLADQYFDAILYGTLARMHSQAKRPYSDPMLAQGFFASYRRYISLARDEMRKGWANTESSFRYPPGWDTPRMRT